MDEPITSVAELVARKKRAQEGQVELALDLEAIKARGEVDFNFFAGLVIPNVMRTRFPPFYLALFNLLTKGNEDPYFIMRFALGLPRGFVKTTFLKILVCWLILYEKNSFILIVGASEPKALDFISDVDDMLGNPQIESIYGRWGASKVVDNSKRKIGSYKGKQVVLVPAGAGTAIRGININHERPDLIVCDDIQTREGALSDAQNSALKEWFTATLVKSISNYGSERMIVFLGNMYPGDCLLQALRNNPEWTSLVTGAILEDGESLWPELKPVRVLYKEYQHDEAMGLAHVWFAEVQNDPLDERYRLLSGPIPSTFDRLMGPGVGDWCFITVDPAGFRKKSDHNVVAVHKGFQGIPVCTQLIGGLWNPKQTVKETLVAALENGACLIGIESTGYQQSLLFWINHFLRELNIQGIKVVELKSNNRTKLARISDYIAELQAGDKGMTSQARSLFTFYANQYKIGSSTNRDDYLDAPAYAKQLHTEYGHLLTLLSPNSKADLDSLPAVVEVDMGV